MTISSNFSPSSTDRVKLWQPSEQQVEESQMRQFQHWLKHRHQLECSTYAQLHAWSLAELDSFWEAIWDFCSVVGTRNGGPVREGTEIATTRWFPDSRVNYAAQVLRHVDISPNAEAIVGIHETAGRESLTWAELNGQVGAVAHRLRSLGVRPGDTAAAIMPHIPQTIVAFLATASVGAIWSVVNPDFGTVGVRDRLAQLDPKVLFTVAGYDFNGICRDQSAKFAELLDVLPTVEHHIFVDVRSAGERAPDASPQLAPGTQLASETRLSAILADPRPPEFAELDFNHPLWVLYSSGTTGTPKGIVHSHGGVILEGLKANTLHYDLGLGQRVMFATSTTWVLWNLGINALLCGTTLITYEGSPVWQTPLQHLKICAQEKVNCFGTGAALLSLMHRSGRSPKAEHDFSPLRSIVSTGSPLPASTWMWAYADIKEDMRVGSDSGGTDVSSGIIGSNPMDPVFLGELTAPYLGVDAQVFNSAGAPVTDTVGELVVTQAMPSMPTGLWSDPAGTRFRDAYFADFADVWRQGDWVTHLNDGGWVVHGRSDATINRGGIRMGSADITQVVDRIPGITGSMVIGAELPDGGYYLPLFVVLCEGMSLDAKLRSTIIAEIREQVSPRYVPDDIILAPGVPTTHTGKLMEVPVKQALQGRDITPQSHSAASNPAVLQWFVNWAAEYNRNGYLVPQPKS